MRSDRLILEPATVGSIGAELQGRAALGLELGLHVPDSWPPELYDEAAMRFTLDRLREAEGGPGWWLYYVIRVDAGRSDRALLGVAGYKGPPGADGVVEIGYGILPEHRRQGFASEAAQALIDRAFSVPEVRSVIAETLPELFPSIGVMEKCRMTFVGEGSEAGVIRYQITRETWTPRPSEML